MLLIGIEVVELKFMIIICLLSLLREKRKKKKQREESVSYLIYMARVFGCHKI